MSEDMAPNRRILPLAKFLLTSWMAGLRSQPDTSLGSKARFGWKGEVADEDACGAAMQRGPRSAGHGRVRRRSAVGGRWRGVPGCATRRRRDHRPQQRVYREQPGAARCAELRLERLGER